MTTDKISMGGRRYPIQVENNTFRSDENSQTNGIIDVYLDSHLYNCELHGVFARCHGHNRNEVCNCENWSGVGSKMLGQ